MWGNVVEVDPEISKHFCGLASNAAIAKKTSSLWRTELSLDLESCSIIGYADGAAKGTAGLGSSSFALVTVCTKTGSCTLLVAGARLWKKCTAIQAELGGAAHITTALLYILTTRTCRDQFSTSIIEPDFSEGLGQLHDTLSAEIRVAGKFVNACVKE